MIKKDCIYCWSREADASSPKITVVSADADNDIRAGSDGGAFLSVPPVELPDATVVTPGIVRAATREEVESGAAVNAYVMPADLQAVLSRGLTANTTVYVRTNGDDSSDGLTLPAAVATISRAMRVVNGLTHNGYKVTVDIGPGEFTFPSAWETPAYTNKNLRLQGAGISTIIHGDISIGSPLLVSDIKFTKRFNADSVVYVDNAIYYESVESPGVASEGVFTSTLDGHLIFTEGTVINFATLNHPIANCFAACCNGKISFYRGTTVDLQPVNNDMVIGCIMYAENNGSIAIGGIITFTGDPHTFLTSVHSVAGGKIACAENPALSHIPGYENAPDVRYSGLSNIRSGGTHPVGTIIFGTVSNFPGWQHCNGSAISRTYYSELFNIIGTTFGEGNGLTTFNLPNQSTFAPGITTIKAYIRVY